MTRTIAIEPIEPQERWTWLYPWEFLDIEELAEDGLVQYRNIGEGVKVNRYGRMVGDEPAAEAYMCALRRQREVDICLALMPEVAQRRLLDVYFRGELVNDHRGWRKAACLVRVQGVRPRQCPGAAVRCVVADNRLDLKTCPESKHCQWEHDTFEVQVTCAIRSLWRVHRGRYQQES